MAMRNIIVIDEEKCNGCGLCVPSCAEGAIQIIDGKARLLREDFCDGLGACLGHCPQDALTIEQREAPEFDEAAAMDHVARLNEGHSSHRGHGAPTAHHGHGGGCPGSRMMQFGDSHPTQSDTGDGSDKPTQLRQWPVELSLLSPMAPYFQGADLLLAADCVPFAYSNFHNRFLKDRTVAVGCPKLDDAGAYVTKLAQILTHNNLKSITVVHMEVPCCSGLVYIISKAMELAGVSVPVHDFTIGIDGTIKDQKEMASGL